MPIASCYFFVVASQPLENVSISRPNSMSKSSLLIAAS